MHILQISHRISCSFPENPTTVGISKQSFVTFHVVNVGKTNRSCFTKKKARNGKFPALRQKLVIES